MSDTRTAPQVQKLVDAIQEDVADATEHLKRGLDVMRGLEGVTKGVNGLSAFLKAQGNALNEMILNMDSEAAAVSKKMLAPKMEITERVASDETRQAIREAKEAAS